MRPGSPRRAPAACLNESPSEKEGKLLISGSSAATRTASMKALPKRKGNCRVRVAGYRRGLSRLNESPSEKEGKLLNPRNRLLHNAIASMKALPKRKGNSYWPRERRVRILRLNESPSEKEGKCGGAISCGKLHPASMKALPKRKGNPRSLCTESFL